MVLIKGLTILYSNVQNIYVNLIVYLRRTNDENKVNLLPLNLHHHKLSEVGFLFKKQNLSP